jgi:hypothetical protein
MRPDPILMATAKFFKTHQWGRTHLRQGRRYCVLSGMAKTVGISLDHDRDLIYARLRAKPAVARALSRLAKHIGVSRHSSDAIYMFSWWNDWTLWRETHPRARLIQLLEAAATCHIDEA